MVRNQLPVQVINRSHWRHETNNHAREIVIVEVKKVRNLCCCHFAFFNLSINIPIDYDISRWIRDLEMILKSYIRGDVFNEL